MILLLDFNSLTAQTNYGVDQQTWCQTQVGFEEVLQLSKDLEQFTFTF